MWSHILYIKHIYTFCIFLDPSKFQIVFLQPECPSNALEIWESSPIWWHGDRDEWCVMRSAMCLFLWDCGLSAGSWTCWACSLLQQHVPRPQLSWEHSHIKKHFPCVFQFNSDKEMIVHLIDFCFLDSVYLYRLNIDFKLSSCLCCNPQLL